ncbi:Hpt domain-containing protein [Ekhidna lutea]|uniref:Hpt domain-containing protein n=1 Tax=Ekhidna lutea TaxID=447679 RepID=A0A239GQR4_EKHLU|nr:Hpt domain-containing protein [Ekhidna lutea]SNS71118.1 Hpt domain-containing protein [Ekhidna lutea]
MEKIDFTYLEVLSEDDDEFKNEFIATFEETYLSLVKKMREELEAGDMENLSKSAHQLKPSAKMIHLRCGDTLEELQYDPNKATKEIIEDINAQCEDALKQLKDWQAK